MKSEPGGCRSCLIVCGAIFALAMLVVLPAYYFAGPKRVERAAEWAPQVSSPAPTADAAPRGDRVHVRGYTRKDGTEVKAHDRAKPKRSR